METKERSKICYGLLLALSIIFLSLLNVYSVLAITKDYSALSFMYNTPFDQTYVSTGLLSYNSPKFNIHSINELSTKISSVSVPSNSNFLSYTSKFNLLTWTDNGNKSYLPNDYGDLVLYSVRINDSTYPFESANIQRFITDFTCDPLDAGFTTNCRTITYQVSFVIKNIPSSISNIVVGIEYNSGSLYTGFSSGFNAYFESDSNNYVSVDFSYDYTSALLQQQIQQNDITINSINNINETIENHYEQEQGALDNISGQTSNDIDGASNQQTTNIIGVLTTFVSTLGSIQSGSCELTLPFPTYAGGNVLANPCSYKEKAPTIVTIGSSLLLITVFIPLAFIVLRLIYNEIRSWTNG